MEIAAGISVVLLILSALLVAIRMFALWLRTRELPELLLGLMLFSVTVVGYPIAIACMTVPAPRLLPLHIAQPILMHGGIACLLLFTLKTFQPKALYARCLVGATMVGLVVSGVLYIAEVTGEHPRPLTEMKDQGVLNVISIGTAYFWTTFESLRYHRQLKLRLRLGLADVVVVDRVRLWGLMTLATGLAVVVSSVAWMNDLLTDPRIMVVSSSLGLVHAGCLYLAFLPPDWYRAWVVRRSALAAA